VTVPELEDEKDPKRTRMLLSKGCEMIRPGFSWLPGDAARVMNRGGESVTLTGLTGFAGNMTRIGEQIGLLGTAGVTRMDTWVGG
jgi:hypothetical protein